ncbi:DgyrCDS7675 [Dimorphilus gyrociliatus]|uniref:Exostosin-2 n=1 Tax=Dimorphilus gyrociliatus TaxID=2664684 RepID=A0A7I8VTZ8_9ANNE|nr:DgyrCDS7675 [Dimorphilus gyrociliatus]
MLPRSKEFMQIIDAILESPFVTSDPKKACVFVPQIDLLNQNNLKVDMIDRCLSALPLWNNGENHLLFNMLPGSTPNYATKLEINRGNSILAGSGLDISTYRMNFDISIPLFNPLTHHYTYTHKNNKRDWLLVSSQIGIDPAHREQLERVTERSRGVLVLSRCEGDFNFTERCNLRGVYHYPAILSSVTFCLVLRVSRFSQTILSEAMQHGCIPVIAMDSYVLPFVDVIDWKRVVIRVEESRLIEIVEILERIGSDRILEMQSQVLFIWDKYFKSMREITLATLQIINDRVFPYDVKSYEDWNELQVPIKDPLFLPVRPLKHNGFTAVILSYDRITSLFDLIRKISAAPSLSKVLVIWNNQKKQPPPTSNWPNINVPLRILQTPRNSLHNRFYPYAEIETEAILSLDDDILMLTIDELEFAYQVWREFPDRLVGFPSRLHLWNNKTDSWKYESEWTSSISMVLTGASFYHKYYSFAYTKYLPQKLKLWIDENMNCEDIAMNFIIANLTGKAPLKVGPRKKFKCSTASCINSDMLSADLAHMVERSECITQFVHAFGRMPLKSVEFRAAPVLYKDKEYFSFTKYSNIGSL